MAAVGGTTSAGMLLQSANAEVQEEAVAALTMLGFAACTFAEGCSGCFKGRTGSPGRKGD